MIRALTDTEINEIYPALYQASFIYPNPSQDPSVVIVDMDGEENITAFLSGYWTSREAFYIQFAGRIKQVGNSDKIFLETLRFIGAKEFYTRTPSENRGAILRLLRTGFEIIGVRHMEHFLYLEWYLEVKDGRLLGISRTGKSWRDDGISPGLLSESEKDSSRREKPGEDESTS